MRRILFALALVVVIALPAWGHSIGNHHTGATCNTWSHGIVNDGNGWGHSWLQVPINASPDYTAVWVKHYQRVYQPESGTYTYLYKYTTGFERCTKI